MQVEVPNFNLEATLESGQIFRYERVGDWYFLTVGDNVVKIRQSGNKIFWSSLKPFDLFRYFNLESDSETELAKEKFLAEAVKTYSGLKIMNQDPWECAVSFICSSCSNIKRIKKNLNSIASAYGARISFEGYESHSFPNAETINGNIGLLQECGLGYRREYLAKLVGKVVSGFDFEDLKSRPYDEAKNVLMQFDGVGTKVADCILLFSLNFSEAFPVDVWIEKVMRRLYFGGRKTSLVKIADYGRDKFGKNAGYAQQFLYHYSRNHSCFV